MVIKTYFDKDNVIVYNDDINTGRNEILELFYGGDGINYDYSRALIYFDESRIKKFYEDGYFCDLSKLKHTLKLYNATFFNESLLGQETCDGKKRACSFDMIVFKIPQEWDEGIGYDYCNKTYIGDQELISTCPSNWLYAKENVSWNNGNGVYSGIPQSEIIATQHFDWGNENLEVDITDYVNGVLTGDTNYGLGIAFSSDFELTITNEKKYVGFFSRHTNTLFEPFVETRYENYITDDRYDFYANKTNKLYLYVNIGGQMVKLDNPPVVTVYDNNDNIFSSITSTCESKGIYSIELNVPYNNSYEDCPTFKDVWSNIFLNGTPLSDVEMEFIVKNPNDYYMLSNEIGDDVRYDVKVYGIGSNERIKRGDIKRINVLVRKPYDVDGKITIDNMFYRIYVKEGNSEYTIIDWDNVNRASNSNYFLLDTNSLIPTTYYLEIKVNTLNEVYTTTPIKFEIIGNAEMKN
jgi:hypothetical protein